jgi:DNA-binding transcriptional regulator PaaX
MEWTHLHHPDISLPVIRRRVGEEIIHLLAGTTELLLSRGLSTLYRGCYPNTHAYHAAISRLKKRGLVATGSKEGKMPEIRLTPEARKCLPCYLTPENFWNRKWNKWWYVLMFDVPETNRPYRDTLRSFLKARRLGCLQKSVWVTPEDIRSDYDDLNRAAAVDTVAFLFEARTVLGFGAQSVVQAAWDFNQITSRQNQYICTANENMDRLKSIHVSEESILQLLRIDHMSYSQAMKEDPLLPESLLPPDYAGVKAKEAHDKLTCKAIEAIPR